MITLRFTQTLLKDMKVTPAEMEEVNPLYSWHVNIYKLNKRKYILFINDLTRLSILIDGVRTSQLQLLKEKFLQTLEVYLTEEQINRNQIKTYLNRGKDMPVLKTNSRSVLGTMKEITIFTTDDFDNNIDRLKWLNRIIHKPIEYLYPIEAFKKALIDQ